MRNYDSFTTTQVKPTKQTRSKRCLSIVAEEAAVPGAPPVIDFSREQILWYLIILPTNSWSSVLWQQKM